MSWFIPELTLMDISIYIAVGFVRMYLIFVVGFKFKVWREKQSKLIQKITYPLLAGIFLFGFIYDIWLNWWFSLPFGDLPKKLDETITHRMIRYKTKEPFSRRGRFAFWLCGKLNKYDKSHC